MVRIQLRHFFSLKLILALLLSIGIVAGCMKPQTAPPPAPPEVDPSEGYSDLQKKNSDLQKRFDRQRAKLRATEAELNRVQLKLLEERARSVASSKRLKAQEQMLDEAVHEVVRAKAKLRTIESRAEAASTMAEAEIAIRAAKESLAADAGSHGQNLKRAEELLKMSTQEFKNENYGGALYLAGQARGHIHSLQLVRSQAEGGATQPGETLFSQPLPLKILKRCNFRQTPDLRGQIIEVLDEGTMIVGFAHKDNWLRVHTEDGEDGWVHQSLAGIR